MTVKKIEWPAGWAPSEGWGDATPEQIERLGGVAPKPRKKSRYKHYRVTIKPTPLAYAFMEYAPSTLRELKKAVKPLGAPELTVTLSRENRNRWFVDGEPQGGHLWLLYEDEGHSRVAGLGPAFVGKVFPIRKRKK